MMNLHSIVRGAINAVNPDISASWQQSNGYSSNADGSRTPAYASPETITVQVQPLSKQDLQHIDFLGLQGVFRTVYAFGNIQGVVRPSVTGGDLLSFPQTYGGTVQTWLVSDVPETWGPGWCRVVVCLQTDVIN